MKASLKFRDDQRPLVRAKIPISILGFPFLSGVSAGDARELRLDLGTGFDSGPSLRISYRPNDPWNPFSLLVKTGIGALGSPIAAPMSMSAEFNLVGHGGGGGPIFAIHFKPRIGDFCIKKITGSASVPAPLARKIPEDLDTDAEGSIDGVETPAIGFRPMNGGHTVRKANGFATELPAAGGIHGLLSGIEVTARSVLPLRSRSAVRFRWGVKVPPELRASFVEDARGGVSTAGISLSKLPLLVMSKISIEHVAAAAADDKPKGKADARGGPADVAEICLSVKRQLEVLQAENRLLRKAVEELRLEAGSGKAAPSAGNQVTGGADGNKGGAKPVAGGKRDQRSDGKSQDFGGRAPAASEDVNEQLKKALMSATGAGV